MRYFTVCDRNHIKQLGRYKVPRLYLAQCTDIPTPPTTYIVDDGSSPISAENQLRISCLHYHCWAAKEGVVAWWKMCFIYTQKIYVYSYVQSNASWIVFIIVAKWI